ncbi:MAG: class II fructose-bisphosphatase [Anaerolineales bacterium]|nr:class II fructose-bisphosphatase [Anaerolineales bacterium]
MEVKLPRNLGMELLRATEAAALTAGQWLGRGHPQDADHAAAQAMADVLNTMRIEGRIVLGEEDKPKHDRVLSSEKVVGTGEGPEVDVLADPVDGRMQLARGFPGVISAAAVAPRGAIWHPPHARYMEKIIVDETVAPYLVDECLDAPPAWTLSLVARAKGMKVNNLSVFVLDRPRHADLIAEIQATGAHVILRPDGDIVGALMVCIPQTGVDLLMGIGGIPEGLLAACAVKALGGTLLGRLAPQDAQEKTTILDNGYDLKKIFRADDLVKSEQVFFAATGITNGPLGRGVIYRGAKAETNSLVLRGETGTRRTMHAEHLVDKWVEVNA